MKSMSARTRIHGMEGPKLIKSSFLHQPWKYCSHSLKVHYQSRGHMLGIPDATHPPQPTDHQVVPIFRARTEGRWPGMPGIPVSSPCHSGKVLCTHTVQMHSRGHLPVTEPLLDIPRLPPSSPPPLHSTVWPASPGSPHQCLPIRPDLTPWLDDLSRTQVPLLLKTVPCLPAAWEQNLSSQDPAVSPATHHLLVPAPALELDSECH